MYYAGIGARHTPEPILKCFTQLASYLGYEGFTLRSGRACGADTAFELGASYASAPQEIYLPWKGFPKDSMLSGRPGILLDDLSQSYQQIVYNSVDKYHPNPYKLSAGARKLMARNYCQIFGPSENSTPSSFVICYTMDGRVSGGTGQAIRIAMAHQIPVFNAYGYETHPNIFMEYVLNFAKYHESRQAMVNSEVLKEYNTEQWVIEETLSYLLQTYWEDAYRKGYVKEQHMPINPVGFVKKFMKEETYCDVEFAEKSKIQTLEDNEVPAIEVYAKETEINERRTHNER